MAKDNAVSNQKVFITLASVLDLQARYMRIAAMAENAEFASRAKDTKQAFDQIIDLLGLPIQKAR